LVAKPPVIAGASRAAGVVGLVTSVLYIGLLVGAGDSSRIPAGAVWFTLMFGAGLLAWFADRADRRRTGRRMLWAAFAIFFVLGVLSIFTIGILFLLASLLCVYSLSRSLAAPHHDAQAEEV
jgi:hypothetical protein